MNANPAEKEARACYAACLGNCNELSKEHIISRGIFGDGLIATRGLHLKNDEPYDIDNLVARILCKRHNNELGILDAEAKRLGDAVVRSLGTDEVIAVTLNGYLIERWCLKLLIGLSVSGWLGFKVTSNPQVVKCIFGYARIPNSVGLFGVAPVEKHFQNFQRHVLFDFVVSDDRDAGLGLFFAIHGLPFFFSNVIADPQTAVRAVGNICNYDVTNSTVVRRPPQLVGTFNEKIRQLAINFDWSHRARRESEPRRPR